MSSDIERVIARVAPEQHGLVTRLQLRDAGVPARTIDHQIEADRLIVVYRAVYRVPAAPRTWLQAVLAATMYAGPEAAASCRTAASLRDLLPNRNPIEVLVRASRYPRAVDFARPSHQISVRHRDRPRDPDDDRRSDARRPLASPPRPCTRRTRRQGAVPPARHRRRAPGHWRPGRTTGVHAKPSARRERPGDAVLADRSGRRAAATDRAVRGEAGWDPHRTHRFCVSGRTDRNRARELRVPLEPAGIGSGCSAGQGPSGRGIPRRSVHVDWPSATETGHRDGPSVPLGAWPSGHREHVAPRRGVRGSQSVDGSGT